MKRILFIITIVLLFTASALIFWAGLSPKTFSDFFALYPVINQTANQIGLLNNSAVNFIQATSSEPILGVSGRIILQGEIWNVEIANNDLTRTNGLSNRKNLFNKKGMLFAFDKMSVQNFWMKDMLIPLDMIFFDADWRIVLIEANLQPSSFPEIFGNKVKSQYVLEVNANEASLYGLQVGDQAIFLNK